MKRAGRAGLGIPFVTAIGSLCLLVPVKVLPAAPAGPAASEVRILAFQGTVDLSTDGGNRWTPAQTNTVLRSLDRLRTGPNSRVILRWSDQSVVQYRELTEIEVMPPHLPNAQPGLRLLKGIFSFFHRDRPGRIRVITRGAAAGIEGTEFVMAVEVVNGIERTRLSVIDGIVQFSSRQGVLRLTNLQDAVIEEGKAPVPTPGFIVANNVLQWCFYYPAVLDLRDLPLTADEQQVLGDSLAAYRTGDLLAALAKYPAGRQPGSDTERVYYAALLLSVGQVEQAETALAALPAGDPSDRLQRLVGALRQLIAAVRRESNPSTLHPQLSTELLAASYYEQSRAVRETALRSALGLARQATTNSPEFGFAWARVAELEFSFGRIGAALRAVDKALALTPRNAEALAVRGFLLAGQNKTREAIDWFNQALAVDPKLGNAWLGRGLCRIRRGDRQGGREDLLVAAALEPQRALLRSYLGKAYSDAGDTELATHELELAKKLDRNDPTAWLYSALLLQQENRVNEAIDHLEHSQELNDNRRLYRSKLLLDQDRAMRSANLARLYDDVGMGDVAVREAGLAVVTDYANYSAHSFLANSYEVERRANLSDTRLETASFNEYLLANLLGPANGRLLAQSVNQLEYSTLLDQDRLGLIANTEYFSRGAWHNSSAQYGTLNGSSYSLEVEYRNEPGERVNQDHEILQLEGKFKQDLTPADSLYFHVIGYWAEGGDIAQRFDEQEIATTYRFEEEQTPTVLAGYHHQWSPGNHMLLLAGRFDDTFESSSGVSPVFLLDRYLGTVTGLVPIQVLDESYRAGVDVYTAEAQQITVLGAHTLVAGARLEFTDHDVMSRVPTTSVLDPNDFMLGTNRPITDQNETLKSYLAAIYAYDYFQLCDTIQLIGGLNYTHQTIPANTITAPVSMERDRQARVSPRAAIVWSPSSSASVRASYAKSLTGSGLGQSVRLEPSQTAGMLQVIRNPVPPSLVGPLDGADVQTAQLLWEGRFHKTYVSLGGQWLNSERSRRLGLFLSDPDYDPPPSFGLIKERVRFNEYALDSSAHRLLGEEWSFGAQYRLAYARLERSYPEYIGLGPPPPDGLDDQRDWRGLLHTLKLIGLYRLPSGIFARAEGVFFAQQREQDGLSVPDDTFWQLNLIAGYRFPRQKAEVAVGVLNVLDRDYRLDPINQHIDPPRSRTFYARLLINF